MRAETFRIVEQRADEAHGVVGGVLDGTGNALSGTGHQLGHLVSDTGSLF